ncbi:MAG: hypothetical protein U0271_04955 [Polyangiaceae bacterium]
MKKRAIFATIGVAFAGLVTAAGCVIVPDDDYREPYEACYADWQCLGGTDCWTVSVDYTSHEATESMCTDTCWYDSDCPYDGACVAANSGPRLCYDRCYDDFDCEYGFACVEDTSDHHFEPVCMPW